MSIFKGPEKPKPPAAPPTKADASVIEAGQRTPQYSSMVSTGSIAGLTRKPNTQRSSLIGGA